MCACGDGQEYNCGERKDKGEEPLGTPANGINIDKGRESLDSQSGYNNIRSMQNSKGLTNWYKFCKVVQAAGRQQRASAWRSAKWGVDRGADPNPRTNTGSWGHQKQDDWLTVARRRTKKEGRMAEEDKEDRKRRGKAEKRRRTDKRPPGGESEVWNVWNWFEIRTVWRKETQDNSLRIIKGGWEGESKGWTHQQRGQKDGLLLTSPLWHVCFFFLEARDKEKRSWGKHSLQSAFC